MKCQIDKGQLTLSFDGAWIGKDGPGSGHGDGWRIQIYWPYFKWQTYKDRSYREFLVDVKTVFRIVSEKGYFGIGGQILGFGVAFDYQKTL